MNKKFVVLIEDDFEVMGNGLGTVEDLQYLPALSFMDNTPFIWSDLYSFLSCL